MTARKPKRDPIAERVREYEQIRAWLAKFDKRAGAGRALQEVVYMLFNRDLVITAAHHSLSFSSPPVPAYAEHDRAFRACDAIVQARRQLYPAEESKRAAAAFRKRMRKP